MIFEEYYRIFCTLIMCYLTDILSFSVLIAEYNRLWYYYLVALVLSFGVTMVINGSRNSLYGPGGGTLRLYHSSFFMGAK